MALRDSKRHEMAKNVSFSDILKKHAKMADSVENRGS